MNQYIKRFWDKHIKAKVEDQYIIVEFREEREVLVNGNVSGFTNMPFQIETGHHTITLGGPKNFTPERHDVHMTETRDDKPLIVKFR